MQIRIAGTVSESIVDGPGFRYVIFTQGCPHGCPGCQNPQTHDFNAGKLVDTEELFRECIEDPLNTGVTFSGGEPFCQAEPLCELAERFKQHGLSVWSFSGWTFEELLEKSTREESVGRLLERLDVLVDGKFLEEQKTLALPFRGSANQRLVDVPASLKADKVIEQTV